MPVRALVTGGAGFIGSNLVDGLAERGDDVVVLDDLSTGRQTNLPEAIPLIRADVADAEAVDDAVASHRPEVIFHFAAQVDVRRSVADPALDARINVGGTICVLESARRHGARVVLASTGGAIYGEADIVPTPEEAPRRPLAPYGQSKAAAEEYGTLYARLHGLRFVALRFANVYGPRQDPLGEGGVVAIYCERARLGAPAVVFGDGEQTRDFVYVGDVVTATLRAAEADGAGPFNIGRGEETSVRALAGILGLEIEPAPARAGEVRRSCLDPSRAAEALGFRARVDVAEGIERTLDWVRSR